MEDRKYIASILIEDILASSQVKDYSAFDNPTEYQKGVIDRLRTKGLEDSEIKRLFWESKE